MAVNDITERAPSPGSGSAASLSSVEKKDLAQLESGAGQQGDYLDNRQQVLIDEANGIGANGELEVKRNLKPRQISMIAIGGAIGTGLVINTGQALAKAGPASLFLGYTIMGMTCYMVMISLGEMATHIPHKRGFAGHATRFVSPSFGLATGYSYLCKYLLISPSQLVAGSLVIQYWRPDLSPAIFISVFIVAILLINFLGVAVFGEVEFWLSLIKIITLVGLILLSFIIDVGGSPSGEVIGFKYWYGGKAFLEYKAVGALGRFLGFWSVMVAGLFAYMGTELIGVTVGEARNPRRTVPSAIRKTFYRIVFFYILSVLLVGMIVPADSPELKTATSKKTSAAASPFVVAIQIAGIRVLPSIINACILIFTLSAANSDQYIASRTLYGLAMDGQAPAIFRRCNKRGVPYASLCFTALFLLLAYTSVSADGYKVFQYFVSCVTIFGGLVWISILTSHIRMMQGMKAQGMSRDSLPYKAPLQPYGAYIALFFTSLVLITKGWDAFTPTFAPISFVTNYIGLPLFLVLWLGGSFYYRTWLIKPLDMDLVSGAREFDEADELAEKEDLERIEAIKRAPIHRKIWMKMQDW